MYGTKAQIANAGSVVAIGATYCCLFRRDWRYLHHSVQFALSMAHLCRIFVV
jgi:hypothetical protein